MRKLGMHVLLKRKYAVVCASILVVGALTIAVLASIPGALTSCPPLLCGKTSVSSQLGLITHIRISDHVFGRAQTTEMKEAKIAHNSNRSASMEDETNQSSTAQEENTDGIPSGGLSKDAANSNSSFSKQKRGCSRRKALLKVFMYDLPPEFHFGMVVETSVSHGATWPADLTRVVSYPGGLTQQNSAEYWLTLDLLNNSEQEDDDDDDDDGDDKHADEFPDAEVPSYGSKEKPHVISLPHRTSMEKHRRPCGAIRVKKAEDADVFFVPFFSSLSYNKFSRWKKGAHDIELQRRVLDFVVKQKAWRRSNGRNHVIVMHHPNSLRAVRASLRGATFVVADFGRLSSTVAHLGKDIVAPYKHIIPSFLHDTSSFRSRPTLLFFQGGLKRKAGGAIRKTLYSLLKDEEGVVFKDRVEGQKGIDSATKGMRSSKFCLHLAGDTPSSNRLFDAIVSHCVPVIVSEGIELPYEQVLDYSKFCVFVGAQHALKKGFILDLLRSIHEDEWTSMWRRLRSVDKHFEYGFPSVAGDAVQMIWKSIAHKVPSIKQGLHKSDRYSRSITYSRSDRYSRSITYKSQSSL